MPDFAKMEERGCERDSDAIVYDWAPGLMRCPKSQMTPDAMERVRWWDDWRRYSVLPYGTGSLDTEPGFVFDAIDCCQRAFDQAMSERAHRG